MAKIIQNNEGCIGCGSCAAVCPDFWEVDYDKGKAFPKGGKKDETTGEYELEITEIGCNKEAADVCPVNIIRIEE